MNCSKCGAQNIDGVSFCGNCGSSMKYRTTQPPETEMPGQNLSDDVGNNQQQPPQSYVNQYSAPVGGPSNGGMVMPNNYLVEAIIVTVISTLCCCCFTPIPIILGIIAIVKANSVTSEFERGNMDQALRNADTAKKLIIWAVAIAVVLFIASSIWSFFRFDPSNFQNEELERLLERFI